MNDRHIPLQIEGDKVVGVGDAAFTPGPWFVSGVRFKMNGGEWLSINRYDESKKQDENIACVGYDPRTGAGWEDARLIAAAPELLAFAQYVADMDDGNPAPLFEKARAAIAKAKGAA